MQRQRNDGCSCSEYYPARIAARISSTSTLFLLVLLLMLTTVFFFWLNKSTVANVSNNNNRRPRLVWHVGIMKSGTTSIQLALREWSDQQKNSNISKKQEHWVYLGPSSFMKPSSRSSNNSNKNNVGVSITDPDFPQRFKKLLQSFHDNINTNVVVSSEYFSIEYRSQHYYRAMAQQLLKRTDWDVQIIIGYRPYYEWIPSRYSQAHKATPQQRSSKNHRAGDDDTYPWKDALGKRWKHPVRPMFPTYYYDTIEVEHIFADDVYEYASPYFHNITILPLQADLVPTFFCDILQVTTTCQEYRQQHQQQQQLPQNIAANPSRLTSIHCDAIALGAAAQGLVDIQQYTRTEIMEAVEREILSTTTKKQLQLICPEQATLDRVWEQTVNKEARLFYPSSSSSGETTTATPLPKQRIEQLRLGFQQYIADKTFCHVNVTAVLEDPDWRRFFAPYGRVEDVP